MYIFEMLMICAFENSMYICEFINLHFKNIILEYHIQNHNLVAPIIPNQTNLLKMY
jgi:hypothetical protein